MTTKTLRIACNEYLTHLEESGQTPGTVKTSRRILDLLVKDMGENKELPKILSVHVDKFYKSESATMMKTKEGTLQPRAPRSALQIRRVVRMALVWFHGEGWMEKVPLPTDERRFLEPKSAKKAVKLEQAELEEEDKMEPEVIEQAEVTVPSDDAIVVEGEADEEA